MKNRQKGSAKPRSRLKATHSPSNRERLIFRYWDGEKEVAADPLEIQAALAASPVEGFDLDADWKGFQVTFPEFQKQAQVSLNRLINAIRIAFKLKPFEQIGKKQVGLTRGECMTVFLEFAMFIDELKKKLGILPTTPSATEVQAEPLPTPNTVDCSSTAAASSPDVPSPLPSEPQSLLVGSPLGSGLTP